MSTPEKCTELSHFVSGAVRSSATGKAPLSHIDGELLRQVAFVMEHGEKKYSRNNWRKGIPYNRCVDSLLRHVHAFLEGETNDAETGLPHLAHAACNVMFLLRYEADHRTDLDDRYKPAPIIEECVGERNLADIHPILDVIRKSRVEALERETLGRISHEISRISDALLSDRGTKRNPLDTEMRLRASATKKKPASKKRRSK